MTRCISHVRVLDVSRTFAWSSWLGQILTDLGAEVIKVEKPAPVAQDNTDLPQSCDTHKNHHRGFTLNGNKSITVDIDKPEGKEIIAALVRKSTILISDFSDHESTSYGFNFDRVRELNDSLIYCLIDSAIPLGFSENDAQSQIVTNMYVSTMTMAAIAESECSGSGQFIDLRHLDDEVAILTDACVKQTMIGAQLTQASGLHPHLMPYQTFPTRNGYVFIAISQDEIFDRFCRVLGAQHIAMDKKFADNSNRILHRHLLTHLISECLQEHSTEFWLDLFDNANIPCGPVNANSFAGFEGCEKQPYSQMDLFDVDLQTPVHVSAHHNHPSLGEHTTTVLQDLLGFDIYKMLELRKAAVI